MRRLYLWGMGISLLGALMTGPWIGSGEDSPDVSSYLVFGGFLLAGIVCFFLLEGEKAREAVMKKSMSQDTSQEKTEKLMFKDISQEKKIKKPKLSDFYELVPPGARKELKKIFQKSLPYYLAPVVVGREEELDNHRISQLQTLAEHVEELRQKLKELSPPTLEGRRFVGTLEEIAKQAGEDLKRVLSGSGGLEQLKADCLILLAFADALIKKERDEKGEGD